MSTISPLSSLCHSRPKSWIQRPENALCHLTKVRTRAVRVVCEDPQRGGQNRIVLHSNSQVINFITTAVGYEFQQSLLSLIHPSRYWPTEPTLFHLTYPLVEASSYSFIHSFIHPASGMRMFRQQSQPDVFQSAKCCYHGVPHSHVWFIPGVYWAVSH